MINLNDKIPLVDLNDGNKMPVLGLGVYSICGDKLKRTLKPALDMGIRLIDTASFYQNEIEIGEFIRQAIRDGLIKREELFVITKIYLGAEMANPEKAIEGCLNRLNISYVDMMLLHHPDVNDIKAYLTMEKYVNKGLIHSLGLSNYYIKEIDSFIKKVNIKPALVQNEIHIYYQEKEVVPHIQNLGIVMQAWYPFGGRGYTNNILNDKTIVKLAQKYNKTPAQIILRWHLQRNVIAIPGSSNPYHIQENLQIFDFKLNDKDMAEIALLDKNEKHDWY